MENKMDKIFDSTIKIEECVQSLKFIITDLEEIEAEASRGSEENCCGIANIVELLADRAQNK